MTITRTIAAAALLVTLTGACTSDQPGGASSPEIQREIERAQKGVIRDTFNQGRRIFRDAISGR